MSLFDLALEALRQYRPERDEPSDFDAFWRDTLDDARSKRWQAEFVPAYPELRAVDVFDVTFSGFDGDPIKGWLTLPRERSGPLPVVVEYVGYGGGRGVPAAWLQWPAAGWASFVMDTRGQGGAGTKGDTPDLGARTSGPEYPGFLTRGILDPTTYYYRRLFTDAVLAADAARSHPSLDSGRVVAAGGSQGGGMALAVAGLDPSIVGALIDVPFLSHPRRALEITDEQPYDELRGYLAVHRDRVDDVFRTLSYVDGLNFAHRANAPALFTVGLMDRVCPPSCVFAAYHHYRGPKQIDVFPYNGHEAGGLEHFTDKLRFLEPERAPGSDA